MSIVKVRRPGDQHNAPSPNKTTDNVLEEGSAAIISQTSRITHGVGLRSVGTTPSTNTAATEEAPTVIPAKQTTTTESKITHASTSLDIPDATTQTHDHAEPPATVLAPEADSNNLSEQAAAGNPPRTVTTRQRKQHEKNKNAIRRPPSHRSRAEKDARPDVVEVTGYKNRIDLTQALPFCPVTAMAPPKPFPIHEKDKKHSKCTNNWNSNPPKALNYGNRFRKICDFFQFTADHPDEEVVKAFRRAHEFKCHRPYSTKPLRVRTEDGNWVPVHHVPKYIPQDYSHLETFTILISFRNISFIRKDVMRSDLTDILMVYSSMEGDTIYEIEHLDESIYGFGQVRVVMDRMVDFEKLFQWRPCIIDHNGIFVLKAIYDARGVSHYPTETIQKKRKNGSIEEITYPVEFINLIKEGDSLS